MNIGRNEKGKLVCWVPAKNRANKSRSGKGSPAGFDGIPVHDLVMAIPVSPLPSLQPVFGQTCPEFEVDCEVSPEEMAMIEKLKQAFAEKYM